MHFLLGNQIPSSVRAIKEVNSAKPPSGPGVVIRDKRRGCCLDEEVGQGGSWD